MVDQQRDVIARKKTRIQELETIIAKVEELEAAKVKLNNKKGIIKSLESERVRYPQFMDDVMRLLPANVWLTSLATISQIPTNSMDVTMMLSALDNYAIADFVANLENSEIFTGVTLGAISTSSGPNNVKVMNFQIKALYKNLGTPNAIKKS